MLISSLVLILVAVAASLLATYLAFAQFALFSTMMEEGAERPAGNDYADQALVTRLLERPRDVYLQLAAGRTAFRWLAIGAFMALGISAGDTYPMLWAVGGAFLLFALEDEIPLRLVLRNPSAYALRLLPPIASVMSALRTFSPLFDWTFRMCRAIVKHRGGDAPLSVEELTMMAAAGGARLGVEERRILRGIFRSSGILVADIMTPREKIAALDRMATVKEALDTFRGRRKSRLPVYNGSLDHIEGVIHAKDFLRQAFDPAAASEPVTAYVHDAYFVRQDRKIQELFEELKESRVHLAVVVDRLGRTVGLVTLDDVLEEIVGEIRDDVDPEKPR